MRGVHSSFGSSEHKSASDVSHAGPAAVQGADRGRGDAHAAPSTGSYRRGADGVSGRDGAPGRVQGAGARGPMETHTSYQSYDGTGSAATSSRETIRGGSVAGAGVAGAAGQGGRQGNTVVNQGRNPEREKQKDAREAKRESAARTGGSRFNGDNSDPGHLRGVQLGDTVAGPGSDTSGEMRRRNFNQPSSSDEDSDFV